MNKLDSLRAAITAALPELGRSPENLRLWIARGGGRCQATGSEAFGFTYEANVLVVEMASDFAVLAHAVFRWLRVHQPNLVVPPNEAFSFDVDPLDNGTADVLLQIQLTQNVTVVTNERGGYDMQYLAEPDPLFDDGLALDGDAPIARLTAVDLDDQPYGG